MRKSAFISDLVFTFSLTSIGLLCILRYYRLGFLLALLLSLSFAVAITLVVGGYLSEKRKKFFLKKSDEREKDKLLLHLSLLPHRQQQEFFCSRLHGELKNGIVETVEEIALVDFRFEPLPPDRLGAFIRRHSDKPKILYCNDLTEDSKRLCERFGVRVLVGTEVYSLLKREDALPEKYFGEESFAQKKRRRLTLCFSKSNSKRFLTAGALVLFTSLLTPFPYYYLICGCVLLAVAVFVRIFGCEP